jgi:hypothetical protein
MRYFAMEAGCQDPAASRRLRSAAVFPTTMNENGAA